MKGIFPMPEMLLRTVCDSSFVPVCSGLLESVCKAFDSRRGDETDTQTNSPLQERGFCLAPPSRVYSSANSSRTRTDLCLSDAFSEKKQVDRRVNRVAETQIANSFECEEWRRAQAEQYVKKLKRIEDEINISMKFLSQFDALIEECVKEMGIMQKMIHKLRMKIAENGGIGHQRCKQCEQKLNRLFAQYKKSWKVCGQTEHALAAEENRLAALQRKWMVQKYRLEQLRQPS